MSEINTIAALTKDGKITMIDCFDDGDLIFLGRKLINYYTDSNKIEELFSLGGIERLGEEISPSELMLRFGASGRFSKEFAALPEEEQRRLLEDDAKHTIAGYRDKKRNDDFMIKHFDNLAQYLDFIKSHRDGYNYLLAFDKDKNMQWYLLQPQGFIAIYDDPSRSKQLVDKEAVNIADLDDKQFVSDLRSARNQSIEGTLYVLGSKYHLGYDHSSDIEIYHDEDNSEYSTTFYDPTTNKPFFIKVYDYSFPKEIVGNVTHWLLGNIVEQVKKQLYEAAPLYTKDEIEQLKQVKALKDRITSFYRKKFDPEDEAFEYFIALCQDQYTRDLNEQNHTITQAYELYAAKKRQFVKSYVAKKVDKLFEALKAKTVESITITYSSVALLTSPCVNRWNNERSDTSKFFDYFQRLSRDENPADDSLFADPLMNSQLYSIVNGIYQAEVFKDADHKLNQISVLQAK